MEFLRPRTLLAGFWALRPSPAVTELTDVGEQWQSTEWSLGSHKHAYWEVYLQGTGATRWFAGKEHFRLEPGDAYVIGPGVKHGLDSGSMRSCRFFFCGLALDALQRPSARLAQAWSQQPWLILRRASVLREPFERMVRETVHSSPHRDDGLRLAVDGLILEISRLVETKEREAGALGRHPAVSRVCLLMEERPAEPWRLEDLARMAGVSTTYLAGLFKKDTGTTIHRHLNELRVRRACRMLSDSDDQIGTIAQECGFATSQHFARIFHQHVGMRAADFRREARQAVARRPNS